jgi:hypothetical protein
VSEETHTQTLLFMINVCLFFLLLPFGAFGQVFVKGVDINLLPEVKVCELLLLEDFVVSPGVEVAIDYGQKRSEFEGKITDASGKAIKFPSAVAAINHMEGNGWEYINNSVIQKGRGVIYRYYFRRKLEAKAPQ